MTKIEEVYRKYYHKSSMFMYPLLGIKRGNSIVPRNNHMCWYEEYDVTHQKFICTYHLRDDREFKIFEEIKLLNNPLFEEFHELESDDCQLGAYVFDLSEHDTYTKIVNGQYSQINGHHKKQILDFFRDNLSNFTYMESFLHPSLYYKQYARILTVPQKDKARENLDKARLLEIIEKTGELYSKPDLDKETLFARKKVLDFHINDVNLSR